MTASATIDAARERAPANACGGASDSALPGRESLAVFRAMYTRNIEALYNADVELASRIDAVPFASLPAFEVARDGAYTARVSADDGRPVYLHSRYQPVKEAADAVAALPKIPIEREAVGESASGPVDGCGDDAGIDPTETENAVFMLAGIGIGHHVAAIEARFNKPFVIVLEEDLALVKAALCICDLAEPIRQRRLIFIYTLDKNRLHECLRPLATPVLLGMRTLALPHAMRCRVAFHNEARALVRDFVSFSRVQMVSLLRNGRTTCRNIALNLGTYVGRPGVEVLANRAAGYPAILVAAGPSLSRNIDQLRELQDRAVIIAVQTTYKTLLARGIRPHFVTSLDYHEISAQFFHGVSTTGETILVAEPKANAAVVDAYRGRKHVLYSGFLENVLRDAHPPRGTMKAGSTVAHLAFYLAQYVGCDPVILIGQDLSFSDGMYYPAGMQIEKIWQPELSRFQTIEMKQWERIARARHILKRVKDIHGREVYTDDQLFTYAEQFQSDFLNSAQRVINATEGGMLLRGCENMSLRDAAAAYCTRALPADVFAAGAGPEPDERRAAAERALEERIGEVGELRALAVEMRGLLNDLVKLIDQPGRFNQVVARVDEVRARIARLDRTYQLVSAVSQFAELRRYNADRSLGDQDVETKESAKRRLRRDREFVGEFIDGCEYLLEILPDALKRLKQGEVE